MIDPTASFLLNAARLQGSMVDTEIPAVSQYDRDFWVGLMQLAWTHRMSSMLYHYLKKSMPEIVPPEMLDSLKAQLSYNLNGNLRKTGELIRILRELSSIGVEAIPYKGPALAVLAYGDLSLREFGDLDLLINRSDYYRSQQLLVAFGYLPEISLTEREHPGFCSFTNVMAFFNEEKSISVELHWEMSPAYLPYSPNREGLRSRLIDAYPGGQAVKTLSIEDLLLYLCVHGAKHAWERLSWIVDVGGLIHRHPLIDWEWMQKQAVELRVERELSLGLNLAGEITGVTFPANIFRADSVVALSSNKIRNWMFSADKHNLTAQAIFLIGLRKGLSDKIRTLFHIIANPSVADWLALRLPAGLAFLYPFLRPFRLLRNLKNH